MNALFATIISSVTCILFWRLTTGKRVRASIAISIMTMLTFCRPPNLHASSEISSPSLFRIEQLTADPHLIEAYNLKQGYAYLWARLAEYCLRIIAFTATSADSGDRFGLLYFGGVMGLLGNLFQSYQGYQDRQLAIAFQQYQGTDKLKFAKITMLRGVINMFTRGLTLMMLFLKQNWMMLPISSLSLVSDSLGLKKNWRDVAKTKGWEQFAFLFCTASRFFFLYSSFAGVINSSVQLVKNPVNHDDPSEGELIFIPAQIDAAVAAMSLFSIGALIRQFIYKKNQMSFSG